MQAQHPSGSDQKATTAPRHLLATAIIGEALIGYLVQKTPSARARLEGLASMARRLGELTDRDATLLKQVLARQAATPTLN